MTQLASKTSSISSKPTLRLVHGRPALKGPVEVKVKRQSYEDRLLDLMSEGDRKEYERFREKAAKNAPTQHIKFDRKFYRLGSPEAQRLGSWSRTTREIDRIQKNMEKFGLLPGDKVRLNRLLKKVVAMVGYHS